MDHGKLAEILFPEVETAPEYYEKLYPKREVPQGAMITRLGPSPTGFIHLGNLYGAFIDERLARRSGGIFYLRIEDTDEKRFVEGAVETIIDSLEFFGIDFDEGAGRRAESGSYGPYFQSRRKDLYSCFAKELVKKGSAYPCFMTEEEIAETRKQQEEKKETPGIYGKYAVCRDLSIKEIEKNISAGKTYVLRLRSNGAGALDQEEKNNINVPDAIRGILTMPSNYQDIVIMKTNGMPTYHFAHVCDDHFMRTTHVVRGEEWLSSLPIHIELFEKLNFRPPIYCHTAQLMKLDENGNRRKLSKRKDPELSLDFYKEKGYHPEAVREYLLTLLNSNYEEWRTQNPGISCEEFPFSIEKMSTSGALFDLHKLNDVSKECLAGISASSLREFLEKWASQYRPDVYDALKENKAYLESIIDIGRNDPKPRKDFICASQMFEYIKYFFDGFFEIEDRLPEEVSNRDAVSILKAYLSTYDPGDDQSTWFSKIRDIASDLSYAARPKDYKKDPDAYKGHVGHVSTVIRIAITGRSQSPDIWTIQNIMGETKVRSRIIDYLS